MRWMNGNGEWGNSQENVTEEKYKELIARIAELEEQLKEKEQPKE